MSLSFYGENKSSSISADGVWTNLRIAPEAIHVGSRLVEDAVIVVEKGLISWFGLWEHLPPSYQSMNRHDGNQAMVTPGLIDCHTHLVYGGLRANEFSMRLSGASYEDIAQAGGGILSTVRATREASEEMLFASAEYRLKRLLNEGVCAIEIKSGYGLNIEVERRQLRVAKRLGEKYDLFVHKTFLGAHALPPEFEGRSGDYIDYVCNEMMPALAEEGLIDSVDVFCEKIAFTVAETEQVFRTAKSLKLPIRLHAEQLSDTGGAALASRYQALSADHLEYLNRESILAMKQSGTVAVLLPGAYYFLRDTNPPPIEALREAGVPMAIATDHNPGSSPVLSLLLMMNMACTLFRMTVPEVLSGVTRHAARALGMQESLGSLRVGGSADFVLWNFSDVAELAYWVGDQPTCRVVRRGQIFDEIK